MAFEMLDADSSGSVNFEEFVAWYKGGCPVNWDAEERVAVLFGSEVLSEVVDAD